MDIIKEVRNFVEKECHKPSSKYGAEPFKAHFVPVARYVDKLATKLGGDREVLVLAGYLHDVGSIVYGRKNHHITGAKIAESKLRELKYPAEKIELVKKCILNHRGSQNKNRESLEEKILAEADAMANFENISGIFKAAFTYENKTQEEARISVLEKLERKWQQLYFEESKNIIKPKYKAIKLLLDDKK